MGKKEDFEKVAPNVKSRESSSSYSLDSSLSNEVKSRAFMSVSPVRIANKEIIKNEEHGNLSQVFQLQSTLQGGKHYLSPIVRKSRMSLEGPSDNKRLSLKGPNTSRKSFQSSMKMSRFAGNNNINSNTLINLK